MSNLSKRVWAEFNKLKRLDRNSNSSTKFIIDSSPFDDEESPSSNYNFLGRLLPMSDPLNQTALKIEIKITNEYPGKPPEVRILTPMHHPNVLENGNWKKLDR
jgi:ubiquitin-protein ligase